MEKLFGTDGIRGVANCFPMTPEMMVKIGKAVGDRHVVERMRQIGPNLGGNSRGML